MPAKYKFNAGRSRQQGKSFALYKLPGEGGVTAVVSRQPQPFYYHILPEGKQGFAFVPFAESEKNHGVFLSADELHTDCEVDETLTGDDFYYNTTTLRLETPEGFLRNVENHVRLIHDGALDKIVAARNTYWPAPEGFNAVAFFKRLCAEYDTALVSLVSIEGVGTWIGATPECLLRVTPEKLTTVALAGTRLKTAAQWGEKESEEQSWVVKYIQEILAGAGVEMQAAARTTIQNGPLEHLFTKIDFYKPGTDNALLAAEILPQLHPTPAVCGLPKQDALQYIITHENFDRGYYAGFLGLVNIDNESALYVNLRCMQLTDEGLYPYAGAGITRDSVPQAELEETNNKMNNLKAFINPDE